MKGSATAAKGVKRATSGSGKEKYPPVDRGVTSKNKGTGGYSSGRKKEGY